jgi:hypothetical protein
MEYESLRAYRYAHSPRKDEITNHKCRYGNTSGNRYTLY